MIQKIESQSTKICSIEMAFHTETSDIVEFDYGDTQCTIEVDFDDLSTMVDLEVIADGFSSHLTFDVSCDYRRGKHSDSDIAYYLVHEKFEDDVETTSTTFDSVIIPPDVKQMSANFNDDFPSWAIIGRKSKVLRFGSKKDVGPKTSFTFEFMGVVMDQVEKILVKHPSDDQDE